MNNKLKVKVLARENAILVEEGNRGSKGEMLGIIEAWGDIRGRKIDITRQVTQAIVDHYSLEVEGVNTIKLIVTEVLTTENDLKFSAEWEEEGEQLIRYFIIFIATTYK